MTPLLTSRVPRTNASRRPTALGHGQDQAGSNTNSVLTPHEFLVRISGPIDQAVAESGRSRPLPVSQALRGPRDRVIVKGIFQSINKEFTREDSFNRSGRTSRRAEPRSMQLIQRHSSHPRRINSSRFRARFGTRLGTRTSRNGHPVRRAHDRRNRL